MRSKTYFFGMDNHPRVSEIAGRIGRTRLEECMINEQKMEEMPLWLAVTIFLLATACMPFKIIYQCCMVVDRASERFFIKYWTV